MVFGSFAFLGVGYLHNKELMVWWVLGLQKRGSTCEPYMLGFVRYPVLFGYRGVIFIEVGFIQCRKMLPPLHELCQQYVSPKS